MASTLVYVPSAKMKTPQMALAKAKVVKSEDRVSIVARIGPEAVHVDAASESHSQENVENRLTLALPILADPELTNVQLAIRRCPEDETEPTVEQCAHQGKEDL